jgi:NDP-sugar pyrophosphorylase family protein
MREKPDFCYFINAGIYVLSPKICSEIESEKYLDMPDLVNSCINRGGVVSAFPLHEYWIDVGTPENYHKANAEYDTIFEGPLTGNT